MGAFDSAGFLVSLSSMSVSVSLLLGLLALLKERLLTRYRARTLYLLGILLTALLLCPWRPALLLPRITLPAVQVMETAAITEDASLPSTQNAQTSVEDDDPAAPGSADGVSPEAAAVNALVDTPPTHQKPGIPWAWVLFAVWLAGALTVLQFQIIRHTRFLQLVRRWRSPAPQEVQAALSEQCAYLRISPLPAYTVPCVQSPTLVGLRRPMLLLPEIEYDPQHLSLMLTHELTHLKHGHLWGKALCCLVSAVHWFNPLIPYLMREMGLLCEMACDEAVLKLKEPEHRSTYVDAILNAALLTKKVRTPLCSPFDGGVKQMNRIKQRIALMTPFRPRRAGAVLIICTLLLALLTGSVLAGEVSASTFSIPESNWLTTASDYMPQADYDLIMSMQTPGWEELSTKEYAKQITPKLPNLEIALNERWPENRFMRHLKYSMAEAHNPIGISYKVPWTTGVLWEDQTGSVLFWCDLNWKYIDNAKLTNIERDRLLDDVLVQAAHAVRELKIAQIQEEAWLKNAGNELGVQLNEIAKELGGTAMSIWFTSVLIDTVSYDDAQLSQEQQELISLLTPEGYRGQTVTEYNAFLETNKDRIHLLASEPIYNEAYKIFCEAYGELHGYPYYLCSAGVDPSLMPEWTMRGRISYTYRLDWKTVDPDHITIGERHDAIKKLSTRINDTVSDIAWEASTWESFDRVLKERLPVIVQEESTPVLTFAVSEVGLELEPLATEEYVHSDPLNVLKAFMTACFNQDTAQMTAVCVPVGTETTNAGVLAQREQLFNSLIEMQPYHWTFGEVKKEPGNGDSVTVDLTLYSAPPKGSETPAEEIRQAQLTQIDGKWYLMPESLQI
jgi:beta-lactamase regulating signal transducer with metallopeptidase domain